MSDRRPIEAEISGTGEGGSEDGPVDPDYGVDEDTFKNALSLHASSVTIVAVREGGSVHATTVSSFMPVSAAPPEILVSLGGGAQVLPFLDPGTRFVVNLLRADQRRLASIYADSLPVGPSPFPANGDPVIAEALCSLVCRVASRTETDGSTLVLARVVGTRTGERGAALVHYERTYRAVSPADD